MHIFIVIYAVNMVKILAYNISDQII